MMFDIPDAASLMRHPRCPGIRILLGRDFCYEEKSIGHISHISHGSEPVLLRLFQQL